MQLAVSTVILALRPTPDGSGTTLWLPLVRRIREPFLGAWALPGEPLEEHMSLVEAARARLRHTIGLDPNYLEQLYAFGGVDRSRDGSSPDAPCPERVVSIVYWALVRADEDARMVAGENVAWFPAEQLPALAFDHAAIVDYALARLRAKLEYTPIAHAFLPDEFTLTEVREVYEAVLGRALDPANFRRQILASGAVEPTGEKVTGTSHRPPSLYRYRPDSVATSPTPPPRSAA